MAFRPSDTRSTIDNELAGVVEPVSGTLAMPPHAISGRPVDCVTDLSALPSHVMTLLNETAQAIGQTDFASLSEVRQSELLAALTQLANEAPFALSKLCLRAEDQSPDISQGRQLAITKPTALSQVSKPRVRLTHRIMCEMRSGNSPSAVSDDFGQSNSDALSCTLADVLQAAIDGKIDPASLYNALPKNLSIMLDDASRNLAQVGFLHLPVGSQQKVLGTVLSSTSGNQPPESSLLPSTLEKPAKKPWWKFW